MPCDPVSAVATGATNRSVSNSPCDHSSVDTMRAATVSLTVSSDGGHCPVPTPPHCRVGGLGGVTPPRSSLLCSRCIATLSALDCHSPTPTPLPPLCVSNMATTSILFVLLALVLVLVIPRAASAPFPTALPWQWQCTITQAFGSMNYSLVYEEYGALGSFGASTSWFWYSMYQTIGRYGNRQTAEFTQLTGDGLATDPYYLQMYYARYTIGSTSTAETCYGLTPVQLGYLAYMHSRAIWTTLAWPAIAWTDGGLVSVPEREMQGNVWTSNTLLILTQDGSVCLANASCWVNGSSPFFPSPASLLSGPAFHLQELVDMAWILGQGSYQSNITAMAAYVRSYSVSDEMPLANWTNTQIPGPQQHSTQSGAAQHGRLTLPALTPALAPVSALLQSAWSSPACGRTWPRA